jgi:hypothetical protein
METMGTMGWNTVASMGGDNGDDGKYEDNGLDTMPTMETMGMMGWRQYRINGMVPIETME